MNETDTLEIKDLNKVYGNKKHAVRGLNLTMYSDQIFALLGHNGAGKTTTISMISGLLPLSSGRITVMGQDSRVDTDEIKKIMGVCPQTNPIYPTLTVGEHLVLYAKVKKTDLSDDRLNTEIDTILKDIDLLDKKNFPAGNLSGGQKRKLCVACAFIAGSKVILLDEPTSGLDVSARRHLWNMLKQYKKDKIIILTTHFMDEADYLGDRIGVIGDGKLLTCGSSLFLKSKFGFGYGLTLVKENSSVSTEKVTQLIEKHIQGAKLEGDISKELKYVLPTSELPNFENLFKELESIGKSELGIESYGVSLTTLEDVFLRIGQQLGKHQDEKDEALNKE
jgi:ATP-binding cassette subfamily A (ABC1) protein 3